MNGRTAVLGILIVTAVGAAANCGGNSSDGGSANHAGETGAGGGTGGAPTQGTSGAGLSCTDENDSASPCGAGSDCCSEMCDFLDGASVGDDGAPILPATGGCMQCLRAGSACTRGGTYCCSTNCPESGICGCAQVNLPCVDNSECCSGFCYTRRNVCVSAECDLTDEADVEECWMDQWRY